MSSPGESPAPWGSGEDDALARAFDTIVARLYPALATAVFVVVRDPQAAEDIVQEVLLAAWRNRRAITSAEELPNYLFRSWPSGSLTLEETIAALRALQQVASPAPRASAVAADGMAASVLADGSPITFSTPCPGGGTYQLNGTNGGWSSAPDANTSPMYELREQFTSCTVSANGRSYTFASDPELRTRNGLRMLNRQTGERASELTYTGAFVVTSEGKTARCAVSFTASMNIDVPGLAGKTEGQLCGQDVNAAEAGITLGPVSLIGR